MPASTDPPSSATSWSESARTLASLALFCHLFCVGVALSSNFLASPLQLRLLDVLRPYLQPLNLDLNFTPYYVASGELSDAACLLEVLPEGADPADQDAWRPLAPAGWAGWDGARRLERLGAVMAFFSQQDETAAVIAQAAAEHALGRRGVRPARIRCRRHLLLSRLQAGSPDPAVRDPDAPGYYQTVYEAQVLVADDGRASIVRLGEAREMAPPAPDGA